MDALTAKQALEKGKATRHEFEGLSYIRLHDSVARLPKGSVRLDTGRVIPGYPSIGRIQALATGLEKQYGDEPFWAEEKIDGFNIRIVAHEGRLLAFSRGGFLCPFSTDRVPELLDPALFDEHPGLIACAELAGPENPYMEGSPPHVAHDVALFVFDLMRDGQPGFIAQAEKQGLAERYRLPVARVFGRYRAQDQQALTELILSLDRAGCEGLVFKGEVQGARSKYVTARSNINDIALVSDALLDLPPEYFTNRMMRLALFEAEHRGNDPDLERELGRALLQGLGRSVQRSREVGRVGHRYRCRFRHQRNLDHFVAHLEATGGPQHVKILYQPSRQQDGYWVLEFERVLPRMTGTLAHALSGGAQFD
ncbi:putative ATP-dependent DNA ligase [Alkalispirillum mobile]|uniref:Putative ATP-dependent DNA ligase n=1 Tax=Alkalispirillum mobile TaxID=85925 RepID=A0A498BZR5_9GAMM|nr:RNA ligase [Alkalispirillum mobile]RLK48187.1 putative ATP-dependent DNA ligase [Alkalispirillum mobile]